MSGQWGLFAGRFSCIKLSFQLGLVFAGYLGGMVLAAGFILLAALTGIFFLRALAQTEHALDNLSQQIALPQEQHANGNLAQISSVAARKIKELMNNSVNKIAEVSLKIVDSVKYVSDIASAFAVNVFIMDDHASQQESAG